VSDELFPDSWKQFLFWADTCSAQFLILPVNWRKGRILEENTEYLYGTNCSGFYSMGQASMPGKEPYFGQAVTFSHECLRKLDFRYKR
jgi:hypothetical protein